MYAANRVRFPKSVVFGRAFDYYKTVNLRESAAREIFVNLLSAARRGGFLLPFFGCGCSAYSFRRANIHIARLQKRAVRAEKARMRRVFCGNRAPKCECRALFVCRMCAYAPPFLGGAADLHASIPAVYCGESSSAVGFRRPRV